MPMQEQADDRREAGYVVQASGLLVVAARLKTLWGTPATVTVDVDVLEGTGLSEPGPQAGAEKGLTPWGLHRQCQSSRARSWS